MYKNYDIATGMDALEAEAEDFGRYIELDPVAQLINQ